jgi:hypothetical protein
LQRLTWYHDCSCKKSSRFYAGRVHGYINKNMGV